MSPQEKIARNFIRNRGKASFRKMINMFQAQESGQEIARILGVSRERVRQWRDSFGRTLTWYQPLPEILELTQGNVTGGRND